MCIRDSIERVRVALTRSPQRSAMKHASALNISDTSLRLILHKDFFFHPYKIQVIQELKDGDMLARRIFSEEILRRVNDDENFIHSMFMSDRAHFHLNG